MRAFPAKVSALRLGFGQIALGCKPRSPLIRFLVLFASAAAALSSANAAELNNGTFRLELGTSTSGLPVITRGSWIETNQTAFADAGAPNELSSWLPEALLPSQGVKISSDPWKITQTDSFIVGDACATLPSGLKIRWIVELSNRSSLFRLHIRLMNRGESSQAVDWFPSWTASWQTPDGADWVRWWEALDFNRVQKQFASAEKVRIGSQLQSSDVDADGNGANPYWTVGGTSGRLYFGLEWCGGWSAKLQNEDSGFSFLVRLPPEATQLVLGPGESVDGPALFVFPTATDDDTDNRRSWMTQARIVANSISQGPLPSFPLTYDHWYAVGFDVDAGFLNRQITSMTPYGFDAFIVDAGWYDKVGSWQPDPSKFQPDEFESMLSSIATSGVKVGIWSCPQFITAKAKRLPPEVDQPPFFEDFIGGYLLDLAGSGFKDRLISHVNMLRQRYSAGWWKYDQTFFSEQTRAGAMKNVLAFQEALRAVREANPDLVIENCVSGGRMINAFTVMTTQATWLRDGSSTGKHHAQENIQLALGALDFMPPWSVYRWTNNLDQLDQQDDELTRFYCRSAMAGTWGISADLSKITEHQQSVVLNEIQNYRRLSPIKVAGLYESRPTADGAATAGATFYDARRKRAAILLYRWDQKGALAQHLDISKLRSSSSYQVTDIDTGVSYTVTGEDLLRDGVTVQFGAERLSALVFIEPLK